MRQRDVRMALAYSGIICQTNHDAVRVHIDLKSSGLAERLGRRLSHLYDVTVDDDPDIPGGRLTLTLDLNKPGPNGPLSLRDRRNASPLGILEDVAAMAGSNITRLCAQIIDDDTRAKILQQLEARSVLLQRIALIRPHPTMDGVEVRIRRGRGDDALIEMLHDHFECEDGNDNGPYRELRVVRDRYSQWPLSKGQLSIHVAQTLTNALDGDAAEVSQKIDLEDDDEERKLQRQLESANIPVDRWTEPREHTLVVGSGFSGVAVAMQSLRRVLENPETGPIKLTMIERRESQFGGGVAYSQAGNEHHVNVPAQWLSAFKDKPGDLVDWLENAKKEGWTEDLEKLNVPEALAGDFTENSAIPRRLFSYYLRYRLDELAQEAERYGLAQIERVTGDVVDIREDDAGVDVELATGTVIEGDNAVITIGHMGAAEPPFLRELEKDAPVRSRVVVDQWEEHEKLRDLMRDPKVKNLMVAGTGLSAMDVVMTAKTEGFFDRPDTQLSLVSRNGLLHDRIEGTGEDTPEYRWEDLPTDATN
ncbi:MAG: FAD/NAD(P)-binding protein, partial [Pseudomonadota bacterium]